MSQSENQKNLSLSSLELTYFKRLSETIKNTQFYHNSQIGENDYSLLVTKLTTWPNDYIIPLLDLFRMFFLHPRSHDYFKKTGSGLNELSNILDRFKNGSDNIRILVLRILNNYFYNEYPRVFICERRNQVLEAVSSFMDSENKNIRSGIASLLFK